MVKKIIVQKYDEDHCLLDMELPPVDCFVLVLEDGREVMIQPTEDGIYMEDVGAKRTNWWDFIDWKDIDA